MPILFNHIHYGGRQFWFGTKRGGQNPLSRRYVCARPIVRRHPTFDRAANMLVQLAREQQVWLDDDSLKIARGRIRQGLGKARPLHREEANDGPTYCCLHCSQLRKAVHRGCRLGVGTPSADKKQEALICRHWWESSDCLSKAASRKRENLRLALERRRLLDRQFRMTGGGRGDSGRNIPFRMSRGEQEQRYDDDPSRPVRDELLDSFSNRRSGQFEEARRYGPAIGRSLNELGGRVELSDPGRIARAVADEEDPLSIVSMAFGWCHAA
jgi:hypothetical protein